MRCDWESTGETFANGFSGFRCKRAGCGIETKSPHASDRIYSECRGTPYAHEWREWIALFAEAFSLDRAASIIRFIRWRAKGSPLTELPPGVPAPNLPPPTEGPGTELKKIFAELGILAVAGCQCDAMANQMNVWGPDGCREHRGEILAHLQTAYDESSLMTALKAGAFALLQGKPKTQAGLLDLAIELAERTQAVSLTINGAE